MWDPAPRHPPTHELPPGSAACVSRTGRGRPPGKALHSAAGARRGPGYRAPRRPPRPRGSEPPAPRGRREAPREKVSSTLCFPSQFAVTYPRDTRRHSRGDAAVGRRRGASGHTSVQTRGALSGGQILSTRTRHEAGHTERVCGLGPLPPKAKGPRPATPKSKKAPVQMSGVFPKSPSLRALTPGGWTCRGSPSTCG